MKAFFTILSIIIIILYYIAKHGSDKPVAASRKADAVEAKLSPEELERQKQELLKDIREDTVRLSNLEKLTLYAKGDYTDQLESERQRQEQKLNELKSALCEVLKKQKECEVSTAEVKVGTDQLSHRNADKMSESHESNAPERLTNAEQTKHTKKNIPWRIICLCAGLLLVVGIFVYLGLTFPTAKSDYEQGLALLEEGNYYQASIKFLYSRIDHEEEGKKYALELYEYASARAEYEDDPCEETAAQVWRDFEEEYNKICRYRSIPYYNEIIAFGKEIKTQADKHDAEAISKIRRGLPYVHMPPEYINNTKLGSADSVSTYGTSKVYTWKAADGCTVFKVTIDSNGYVSEAEKYRENTHWNGNTLLSTHEGYSSKPSYSYNSDPYDAGAYSNAEDFYYDYYDDFFDYEDALYYWNSHN